MSSSNTTVEIVIYAPGAFDTQIYKVTLSGRADDTLNDNQRRLRDMWQQIEENLAKRGLV